MHAIKEKLMDELYDFEEKVKKNPTAKMSDAEIQRIHTISDTVKNFDKIEMLEGGEYSEDDGMSFGTRSRRGYSRDGEWTARGNYNSPHHMGGGHSYDEGGSSYARRKRDSRGQHSRDGGKENMTRQLRDMMEDAEGDQRDALRDCISKLERM